MLSIATEFPQAGSAAFVKGTADPVTILQHVDDHCIVRREARPREAQNRNASGNTRIPRAELFETPEEALATPQPRPSRRARSAPRRQQKARR